MKKLLLATGCVLVLAACNDQEDESADAVDEAEENHEEHAESNHDHTSHLDMEMILDDEAEPPVLSAELHMEDDPYEADRVRFEIVDTTDEENVEWADGEAVDDGVYAAELEDVEAGTYNVVLHVNGPDDLHEHTEETFEISE